MSEFITLDRNSSDFETYLRGTFSKNQRALPVKSLNINSAQETVTFQVVPVSEIQRPFFIWVWLKALHIRSYVMVLFPMFLVATQNVDDHTVLDPWTFLAATLGVLFLFSAFNLRNDFLDHMKGFDRIDSMTSSHPIQKGWVTAESVRKLANWFLLAAVLCAFPVIIAFPLALLFVLITSMVSYFTLYRRKSSFKELAGSELGILLLVGPLLMSGYEIAMAGTVSTGTLWLGMLWGWMSLLTLHLQNLELILAHSQAGISTLMTRFGFDRGKKIIFAWWFIATAGFIGYHFFYEGFFWTWFYSSLLVVLSVNFSYKLLYLGSPMGSEMQTVRRQGGYLLYFVVSIWIFERIWSLLT